VVVEGFWNPEILKVADLKLLTVVLSFMLTLLL